MTLKLLLGRVKFPFTWTNQGGEASWNVMKHLKWLLLFSKLGINKTG